MIHITTFYFLLHLFITVCSSLEREITVNVDAGKEDCFFQNVKSGQVIDLDYQVIDGGHGDLDITFHIADPTNRILVADYKKSENTHRVDAKVEGDYKFCFDNTFSSYNSKTIFFEFIIEGDNDDIDWTQNDIDGLGPDEVYGLKLEVVLDIVNNVKVQLNKARHLQELIKSNEARDRNLAEENYFIVNTFSTIQIAVMLAVGLIQVVMVKSLFDDSSKMGTLWRKLNQR